MLLCSAAYTITDLPLQMDAALQPSAVPAALLNTQVRKIKDTRCLVCQRAELCALRSAPVLHTQEDSWFMIYAHGVKNFLRKKNPENHNFKNLWAFLY